MYSTRISVFLFFLSSSCGQTNHSTVNEASIQSNQPLDTSKYAIIQFQTMDKWLFTNVKPTTLTQEEIKAIENILKNCIEDYNPKQQMQP